MAKQLLILDGDHILHRCCAAAEHEDRWDEDNRVLVTNVEEAWDTVQSSIKKVFEHFGEDNHAIAMGSGPYFRHTLLPEYKGQRGRKPLGYHDVKARMMDTFKVVHMAGIEADDIMGILATKPGGAQKIIVAKDKDMKSIPGKLWDGSQFFSISEWEADCAHLTQSLVGDRTDNYPGCPGIGAVKAAKLLNAADEEAHTTWHANPRMFLDDPECFEKYGPYSDEPSLAWRRHCLWEGVVEAFEAAGLTEADALLQARIARILRWSDWDSKKKEPILWTP